MATTLSILLAVIRGHGILLLGLVPTLPAWFQPTVDKGERQPRRTALTHLTRLAHGFSKFRVFAVGPATERNHATPRLGFLLRAHLRCVRCVKCVTALKKFALWQNRGVSTGVSGVSAARRPRCVSGSAA
jgi:hypothetical protein